MREVFGKLNGILLPGGGASLDPNNSVIYRVGSILYEEAEKSNAAGERFPIWGTCLGWELLTAVITSYDTLKESGLFVHEGVSSSLFDVKQRSSMFGGMKHDLIRKVKEGEKYFYYSHEFAVTPEVFKKTMAKKCWVMTAQSHDSVGKAFVAAAESLIIRSRRRRHFVISYHSFRRRSGCPAQQFRVTKSGFSRMTFTN